MIKLETLRLSNVVSYKKCELDLSFDGVTIVYGKNVDARVRGSNNGAGKSLLMRQIPLLRFRNAVLGTGRRGVKANATKTSVVELDFRLTHESQDHLYTYLCSGGKNYDLLRDGKPSKIRTQAYAQQKIDQMLPMSEEAFYSLYYLDARRPSLLQMGKEASRLDFFTQMFKLDDFDNLKKLFSGDLYDLKSEKKALSEVDAILNRMHERVSVNIEDIKSSNLKTEAHITSIENKLRVRRSRLDALRTATTIQPAIDRLSSVHPYLPDAVELWIESVTNKISALTKKYRRASRDIQDWMLYDQEQERYRARYKKISSVIKSLHSLVDYSNWEDNRDAILKHIAVASKIDTTITQLSKSISAFERLEKPAKTSEELSVLLDKCRALISKNENILKTSSRFIDLSTHVEAGDVQCPVCRNEVSKAVLNELVSDATDRKVESSEKIKDLTTKLRSLNARSQLSVQYESKESEYLQSLKDRKLLSLKRADFGELPTEEDVKHLEELGRHTAELHSLEKPSIPERERPNFRSEDVTERLEYYAVLKQDAELITSQLSSLKELSGFSEEDLRSCEKEVTDLSNRLEGLTELYYKNKSIISQHEHDQSQIEELHTRKTSLTDKLEDLPVYEMLVEAYSNKGLKRIVVNNLASRLQANLNQFSPLLNRENVEYEFIVNPTSIDILAHRSTGVSDVCELSGAESRAFNFLLPLALLSMLPSNERLNVMIFDEPCVNMDAPMQDMFIKSFLPALKTVIPSIFILEPSNIHYHADRVITAVKNKGLTKLEYRNV